MSEKNYSRESIPQVFPTKRLQWEPAQDCWVILYPEGMVKLNGSSAEIMQMVDGERSVDAIINALKEKFDGADLDDDVLAFMEVAHEQQWIRPKSA